MALRLPFTLTGEAAAAHRPHNAQRHGFRLTGELGDLMPDGDRPEWVMERPLTR